MKTSRDRRGFALPAAMGALVIIGILVTAGFYMARQEIRIGVASQPRQPGREHRAGRRQRGDGELERLSARQHPAVAGHHDHRHGVRRHVVGDHREREQLPYLLTATGTVTEGGALWSGAQRTIGIAAKILFADINPPAALMTRGEVLITGAAEVNGTNTTPPSWGPYCTDFPANDTTGIMVNDSSLVTGGKGATGNPPIDEDSTIVDSTFTDFGNLTWDELVDVAKIEGRT
jgi:hypothetical protein